MKLRHVHHRTFDKLIILCAISVICLAVVLVLVLVLKDSLRTYFKSLFWSWGVRSLSLGVRSRRSLSWSLGVRSLSLSWSLGVRSLLTSLLSGAERQGNMLLCYKRSLPSMRLISTLIVSRTGTSSTTSLHHGLTSFTLHERTISISSRDPDFVTPEIKYLLRQRNSAMRRNKIELAAAITSRVGRQIEKQNAKSLSRVNKALGTGQLWKAVNNLTGKQRGSDVELPISVEEMNSFYAAASTDTGYLSPVLKTTASPNETICLESHIFTILDTLKPTAEGMDRRSAGVVHTSIGSNLFRLDCAPI